MKILTLLYSKYTEEYGINDSSFNAFNKNSYIIKGNDLLSKIKKFLEEKKLLTRKINIVYGLREEKNELDVLARIIQEINPKATIIEEKGYK